MLEIFSGNPNRHCSRRECLQVGTLAFGGFSLPGLLSAKASAEAPVAFQDKSIVMLFLTGGPSQIETFDPKMTAPREFRSVTGEVSTSMPGVTFGGTFPLMAPHADKMAIVRSFTHGSSNHTTAVEQVIRGGNPINHTGMGSIVSRLRGTSHPRTGMPTHVYIASDEVDRQFNKERLRLLSATGPGELGGAYGPFQTKEDGIASMRLQIPRARLDDRVSLQRSLDRINRNVDGQTLKGLDEFQQQALDLILGKSRVAFDLSGEDKRLVKRYDTSQYVTGIHAHRRSTLGQQMLLARRLCEAGCGFVTIHNPGWDMHGGPTQYNIPVGMEELGRPVDRAVSAFLEDVEARGLSDRILLIITGEFGRTVRVKDNGGRDHWPTLSTLAFAGGGLKMGQVIGQSSAKAEEPKSDPVTLDNLFATVMHSLIDVASLRQQGRLPREVASLFDRGQPIRQLF